jgi:hypothetical protein
VVVLEVGLEHASEMPFTEDNQVIEAISLAWLVRNVRQFWDGGFWLRTIYFDTAAWETSMPSFSNSPWIRGAPQRIGLRHLADTITDFLSNLRPARAGTPHDATGGPPRAGRWSRTLANRSKTWKAGPKGLGPFFASVVSSQSVPGLRVGGVTPGSRRPMRVRALPNLQPLRL